MVDEPPVDNLMPLLPCKETKYFLGKALDDHFFDEPWASDRSPDIQIVQDTTFNDWLDRWFREWGKEIIRTPWNWVDGSQHLEALGYRSIPASSIINLLANTRFRNRAHVFEHIWFEIIFQQTSLDSNTEETFLPFTPVKQHDLAVYFQALEKTKCQCQL
jgi:hypothetical protein